MLMAWLMNWNNKQSFGAKLKGRNGTILLSLLDNCFYLLRIPFIRGLLIIGSESKVLLCPPMNGSVSLQLDWGLLFCLTHCCHNHCIFVLLTSTIPTTIYSWPWPLPAVTGQVWFVANLGFDPAVIRLDSCHQGVIGCAEHTSCNVRHPWSQKSRLQY